MNWLARLLRRNRLEHDLGKELQFHIAERISALKNTGLSEEEARRRVRQEFGGIEQVKEECRDARRTVWLESTVQDLRYALRLLRKTPAFTVAAVATLALGIGANTAIFQLLDAVRLRSLPVADPERLALIQIRGGNHGWGISHYADNLSYPLFEQVRTHQEAFAGVFAWDFRSGHVGKDRADRLADILLVSGDFFPALQVAPAAGRLFRSEDDNPAGCSNPGVILSYRFWHAEFAGQLSAIGARMHIENQSVPIIGVAVPGFTGPEVGRKFDIAAPLCAVLYPANGPYRRRDVFWLNVMGSLKAGWTVARASEHLQAISPALMQATEPQGYSQASLSKYRQFRLEAAPGATGMSRLRENYDKSLCLLLGITGLVLLIACANLANLILARASTRRREFALRVAIGASRNRLVRQTLCESLLLTAAGAFLGVYVAKVLIATVIHFLSTENNPLQLDTSLDWRIIAFMAAATISVCIVLGLAPALRSLHMQPAAVIKSGGRSATAGRNTMRFQQALVILQVAISLVLVTGSLLFVGSFRRLTTLDPGFREQGILMASFDMSRFVRPIDKAAVHEYQRQLLNVVRSTPGVEAAASTTNFLIGGGMWSLGTNTNGRRSSSRFTWISPGYFATLETPILAGRDFNNADSETSPKVAIVNQRFARRFFPNTNPLGRTFRTTAEPNYPEAEYQIIGLIKDTKYFDLREPAPPIAYAPASQYPPIAAYSMMYIRSSAPLSAIEAAVRHRVAAWHSDIAMEFHIFQQQIADGLVRERLLAFLSGFFGFLAILLATVGLYGVLAYQTERRRNEIGIRMALGATRCQIIGVVVREVALLVVAGVLIGFACSVALARAASSLLFDISAHDPLTFAAAAAVLACAASIGSLLPALNASRSDPITALRDE
jgi:predicted permease